ncbi:hypothetical protein ACWEQ8_04085, partial [Streptomyces noursei]
RFDLERAQQAPGWVRELNGDHVPETEEYGISTRSLSGCGDDVLPMCWPPASSSRLNAPIFYPGQP